MQEILQPYSDLQDIIAILGMDELSDEEKLAVARPRRSSASCPSPSTWPRPSPARRRVRPDRRDVRSFKEMVEGQHDELPEGAFFLKGSIEQVIEAAKQGLEPAWPRRSSARRSSPRGRGLQRRGRDGLDAHEVGSLGILANHTPLLGLLAPTELGCAGWDDDVVRLAQGEGYVQVADNEVLILVEEATEPGDLDVADLRDKLQQGRADGRGVRAQHGSPPHGPARASAAGRPTAPLRGEDASGASPCRRPVAAALALFTSLAYGTSNYLGPRLARDAPYLLLLIVGQGCSLVLSCVVVRGRSRAA